MANEYVDEALVKLQLGGITDTVRDDLLAVIIEAASRRVDTFTGRRFYKDALASARVYDPRSRLYTDGSLLIDDAAEVPTLIEVGSGSSWTAVTDYELGPENALSRSGPITMVQMFDRGFALRDRVRVTAKWGFPAVPPEVVEATLILSTRYFKRKDSPEGVLGSSEWGTVRITRQDSDVTDLLSPYVIMDAV